MQHLPLAVYTIDNASDSQTEEGKDLSVKPRPALIETLEGRSEPDQEVGGLEMDVDVTL